ncbi:MAG: winged helix-turn-helix transcriptional regulator [Phycisphaerales bacterium]|nr:MAG: winged helix-turn-helix transcriptional regulator [Phycisphaerales bacterium]
MSKQEPAQSCFPSASTTEACCSLLGRLLEPRFFKALGDGNRIALLSRLAGLCRPCTVSEIACCCPVDLSVVSRHLAILRDAGIVDAQRRGKEVLYTVNYDVLAKTFRQIADAIDTCCSGASSPQRKERENG